MLNFPFLIVTLLRISPFQFLSVSSRHKSTTQPESPHKTPLKFIRAFPPLVSSCRPFPILQHSFQSQPDPAFSKYKVSISPYIYLTMQTRLLTVFFAFSLAAIAVAFPPSLQVRYIAWRAKQDILINPKLFSDTLDIRRKVVKNSKLENSSRCKRLTTCFRPKSTSRLSLP